MQKEVLTQELKSALKLEWIKNFISVDCFADYYQLTRDEAIDIIYSMEV